ILMTHKSLQDSISALKMQNLESASDSQIFGMPLGLARIFIPVIVTLLVFALGQFLVWLKSKYEKKNEVTSYRELILGWVDLIEQSVTQQVNACNDFSTRLQNSED